MTKKVLGICGSASRNSANLSLLQKVAELGHADFTLEIFDTLHLLPHFQTELSDTNTPDAIQAIRSKIAEADAVLFSTPEYVFSIPSGLKNLIEWCVSTTVFSDKPVGIITASASGEKGHEELILILKTIQAQVNLETCLLIRGIKGKYNTSTHSFEENTMQELHQLITNFKRILFASN
ncbi:MAG: NAD(P)H-dependent oxidoreductase [Bacteroidetes bacterium]|nr:MAG: NAD(P)H-dependent oxidoreductase [Bacteroidota bacterium]